MPLKNFRIMAGNSRTLLYRVKYSSTWSDEAKRGDDIEAEDIASARFLLKSSVGVADSKAVVEKTTDDGIVIEDGKVYVSIEPNDTKTLSGKYFGTLRLYMADTSVHDAEHEDYIDEPACIITITHGAVEATE